MTLQTSGAISFQEINVELNKSPTATISLNDADVRKLLGKMSGTISMQDAYGKPSVVRFLNTASRTSVSIFTLMGSPTAVANYIFENRAEIGASTSSYALRTGVFPAGSTLTIINHSTIRGKGGNGSDGVHLPGEAGGDAIYLDMDCAIDNSNGQIFAGGGGGGSTKIAATTGVEFISAGGGGGAGLTVSGAGTNTYSIDLENVIKHTLQPMAGTSAMGGIGGVIRILQGSMQSIVANGGAGGARGESGAVGSITGIRHNYKYTPTVGVAGSAGRAVTTNGKSLTQVAGFEKMYVKGAIG